MPPRSHRLVFPAIAGLASVLFLIASARSRRLPATPAAAVPAAAGAAAPTVASAAPIDVDSQGVATSIHRLTDPAWVEATCQRLLPRAADEVGDLLERPTPRVELRVVADWSEAPDGMAFAETYSNAAVIIDGVLYVCVYWVCREGNHSHNPEARLFGILVHQLTHATVDELAGTTRFQRQRRLADYGASEAELVADDIVNEIPAIVTQARAVGKVYGDREGRVPFNTPFGFEKLTRDCGTVWRTNRAAYLDILSHPEDFTASSLRP